MWLFKLWSAVALGLIQEFAVLCSEGQNETALLSFCTCLCPKEILLLFNARRMSLFIIYIRNQILEPPLKHFWLDPFYKAEGMGFKQIYMVDSAPQSSKTEIL